MKRRDFLTLLGGAVAAWPLAARAQQQAVPVIGYLDPGASGPGSDLARAFRKGLSEAGFVESQNVTIEYRWADGQYDRLPALASDLVAHHVAVIVATNGLPTTLAAKGATTTIPIVFYVGIDPVAVGVVDSLSRPGGNITGVTGLGTELGSKRLELLHTLRPTATLFALLVNPDNPASVTQSRDLQVAANTLGLHLQVLYASNDRDLDVAFDTLTQLGAGGLVLGPDGFINSRFEKLATLSEQHAMPTIYQYRGFAAAGGTISYGGSTTDAYRLVGIYCGRILKGEKPSDLPVQQATRVELIINLKTAKALGLDVPLSLLARADEVIE